MINPSGSNRSKITESRSTDLKLPNTLTDLDHHCWVVSGASVMQDGNTIVNGYGVDLDRLELGTSDEKF